MQLRAANNGDGMNEINKHTLPSVLGLIVFAVLVRMFPLS